ncbi:MlaE family lipid ABC transporter permease subunit [Pacificispira spongiicola]|uniref:MlaE family lipid ABC transporter permease subunit n=1 Tax=Pacificispira spongiicola TaxID=2729598 RepID=UPI0029CA2C53|nr:MlaE family lipid ABC transporter permease subunit [Pacificispira spongiicola]
MTGKTAGTGADKGAGWMRPDPADDGSRMLFGGDWTVDGASALDRTLKDFSGAGHGKIAFDLSAVSRLDSAGAWMLFRAAHRLSGGGTPVEFVNVSEQHRPLLEIVGKLDDVAVPKADRANALVRFLARVGEGAFDFGKKGLELLNFVGLVAVAFGRSAIRPNRLRPNALITQIERTGLDALPIVGLLSFLVGVVLAYLMSDQLRKFGAEVFTVNLVGLSMFREVAVLITAIVVAGRSGSAFTAQIGTMKVNEEIDAMGTLGLDPVEVLVLPRVLALMITLPFLAFFADIMGVLGGGVMTVLALDLSPSQFVTALKGAVDIDDFVVGLVKAPVHAYIIAIVGCYEGLKVQRTAESVGHQTTVSVVESVFLVIVATALFSIFFSILGV